jgi:hypothetical protein
VEGGGPSEAGGAKSAAPPERALSWPRPPPLVATRTALFATAPKLPWQGQCSSARRPRGLAVQSWQPRNGQDLSGGQRLCLAAGLERLEALRVSCWGIGSTK